MTPVQKYRSDSSIRLRREDTLASIPNLRMLNRSQLQQLITITNTKIIIQPTANSQSKIIVTHSL